jgi:uncharacterized protein YgiM (DUF1202 family)
MVMSQDYPMFLYAIPFIVGAFIYIKKALFAWSGANELKKEEGYPPIGAAVAIVLTCILPFMALSNIAAIAAKYAKEEKQFAAEVTKLSGKSLTVSAAVNLRAEPSNAGNVIKTLKENDVITATGNVSGLWVPVESQKEKGYVFAPAVIFKEKHIFNDFPYDATAAASIQLYKNSYADPVKETAHKLSKGSVVTVIGSEKQYVKVEFKNVEYQVRHDAAENLVAKLSANGSVVTAPTGVPAEFKDKKKGFYVVTTQDIEAEGYRFQKLSKESISAGEKFYVEKAGRNGVSVESPNSVKIFIYYKYLKPAD